MCQFEVASAVFDVGLVDDSCLCEAGHGAVDGCFIEVGLGDVF